MSPPPDVVAPAAAALLLPDDADFLTEVLLLLPLPREDEAAEDEAVEVADICRLIAAAGCIDGLETVTSSAVM